MTKIAPYKANDIVQTLPENTLQLLVEIVFLDQLSDADIATHFHMTKPTLYKLKRTSRFQNALKVFGEIAVREANTRIQASTEKAVQTLLELLESDNPSVRLKASIETIRLAGLGQQPLPDFTPDKSETSDRQLALRYLNAIATNSKPTIIMNEPTD